MNPLSLTLILADDDLDDCLFFKEALSELSLAVQLTIVSDGDQLMHVLSSHAEPLPDVIFLDLNMPRKTGYECLVEIKRDGHLKQLPVIILSTSFEQDMADRLYQLGAHDCIRKPVSISQLKLLIQQSLTALIQTSRTHLPTDTLVVGDNLS